MLYAIAASVSAGLLSRQWAGFISLIGGLLIICAGMIFLPFLMLGDAPAGNLSNALGRATGCLLVEGAIILLAGLIPFVIRKAFSRRT